MELRVLTLDTLAGNYVVDRCAACGLHHPSVYVERKESGNLGFACPNRPGTTITLLLTAIQHDITITAPS